MARTVDGDIFISPDGKRRAYAQVTAWVTSQSETEGASRQCLNNSRLFVSSNAGPFDLVFLQEATDTEGGNSLEIVDWSPDGRRLLLQLAQWQYESPGVTRTPIVYRADTGIFQQPDLTRSFHKQFGIDCSLEVHVSGFSNEGKIVIETEPMTPEEEEVLAVPSCARKKGQWLLTIASETLTPLPETTKIAHNAKIEPQPAK